MIKPISEFGKIALSKDASEAVKRFCNDLMDHAILPETMTSELGSVLVDGDIYTFTVTAVMKSPDVPSEEVTK